MAPRDRPAHRPVRALPALIAAAAASCAPTPREPRMRLGSLPFPGLFSLYATVEPDRLGVHRYEGWWESSSRAGETGRGILYTCRAGFVDLSHIRETMDWTRYLHDRVLARLRGEETGPVEVVWSDTRFRLEVSPPAWPGDLSPADREATARAVAIRFGQRAAVVMGAWHELATWWGQETVPGISEKRSAFTWDDSTSHAAAALAAGRALRSPERNWNLAATSGLREQLAEMGAVPVACEAEAVRLVEGSWWSDGDPLKRDLNTGLTEGVKTPWLVPGLACCGNPEPLPLPVAQWRGCAGVDWGDAIRFVIRPPRWLAARATGLPDPPAALTEADLAAAIERLRMLIRAEQGPAALEP